MSVDRRTALRWTAAAGAGLGVTSVGYHLWWPDAPAADADPLAGASGYGLDPNLVEPKTPWPGTLTKAQMGTVELLCDFILPASTDAPSASAVGIHNMIDEWVSAPYPAQRKDRDTVLAGLTWLDEAADRLGAAGFAAAQPHVRERILAAFPRVERPSGAAPPPKGLPPGFYRTFRQLVIGGYYTTEQGFADIGYDGNQPLESYPAPSAEVERALEAAYAVLGLADAPGL